jgi:hypothetical protein
MNGNRKTKNSSRRYWRMAMRDGNQGPDRFPECFAKGIAAIDYCDGRGRIVTDCRRLTPEQFEETWRRKWPRGNNPRANLRHIWLHMKKGDIIYAKTGTQVVGKGRIISEYAYDPTVLRGKTLGERWAHYVRVRWENNFVPFHCAFDAVQCAILELTGQRLANLQKAESAGRTHSRVSSSRTVKLPEDALPPELVALEGQTQKVMILHRRREGRLRRAKIQQAVGAGAGRLRCEVPGCAFDFFETYGDLGNEFAFVHHLKGLAARGKPSQTRLDDLAIVCGNCHPMIHKGGGCRPLEGLIPRQGK